MNLKYALRWLHISSFRAMQVLYTLKPFEDSEPTGLKVDIGERERENSNSNSNSKTLFYKACSLGSVKNLSNNLFLLCERERGEGKERGVRERGEKERGEGEKRERLPGRLSPYC